MVNVDASCLGKMRYASREQAEKAYKGFKRHTPRNRGRRVVRIKHEQYPYKCIHCGGWHLARK